MEEFEILISEKDKERMRRKKLLEEARLAEEQ
jgi:hypothetical protein